MVFDVGFQLDGLQPLRREIGKHRLDNLEHDNRANHYEHSLNDGILEHTEVVF